MLSPTNLNKAFELALLQEQAVETMEKMSRNRNPHHNISKVPYPTVNELVPYKGHTRQNIHTLEYSPKTANNHKFNQPGNSSKQPTLNQETRKTPNPCFKCGERYFNGHQCKYKVILNIEECPEEKEEGEDKRMMKRKLWGLYRCRPLKEWMEVEW